jgi:hypothetical protein
MDTKAKPQVIGNAKPSEPLGARTYYYYFRKRWNSVDRYYKKSIGRSKRAENIGAVD